MRQIFIAAEIRHRRRPINTRRQNCRICQIVAHNQSQNPPTTPRSPRDHSCEGRNLTVSCATIRQIRPRFPVPRKTIPAKAGISQCRVPQFADSPPIPRPPEDHSCVGRNLTVSCATIRQFAPDSPSPERPFLRRQESHSVVCHNSPIRRRFPVPRKTIPAKAGISQKTAASPPKIRLWRHKTISPPSLQGILLP